MLDYGLESSCTAACAERHPMEHLPSPSQHSFAGAGVCESICMAHQADLGCTLGLGRVKRVPLRLCFLRTPYCCRPSGPTTTSTLSRAALPQRSQNRRPCSCTPPLPRWQCAHAAGTAGRVPMHKPGMLLGYDKQLSQSGLGNIHCMRKH